MSLSRRTPTEGALLAEAQAPENQLTLAARAEQWARRLTGVPSVTGTSDEAAFADELVRLLRASPAFDGHPERVWQVPVPGGRHPRSAVLALLRGKGARTVVLTGHFDTVETASYGALAEHAYESDRLSAELITALSKEPANPQSERALADLRSGEFLPGRGLLDMKAGLAAAIAVIEDAARETDRVGNLLFVAVPDEEANSAGARHMAAVLGTTLKELGLGAEAALNLDAIADDGDGTNGQVIALGSIGKLLPSALVVGQPVHASYALNGLNATALAGALASAIEWLPELTPRTADELGSAPTLLGMRDSKRAYDVTTPCFVWMFWNVALHRTGAGDVLDVMHRAATSAVEAVVNELAARKADIRRKAEEAASVPVLTFDALFAEAAAAQPSFRPQFEALGAELAQHETDLPEQNRRLTEFAWQASRRSGPAIVLGFASTPYLPVELRGDGSAARLGEAVRRAASLISGQFNTSIRVAQFFPAISDMSFLGQADTTDVPIIARNTPAWGSAIRWPDRGAVANLPIVNVGPWGRDYHTRLERAHRNYSFNVLPALVAEIVRQLFAQGEARAL